MVNPRPDRAARAEVHIASPARTEDRNGAAWRELFTFRAAPQPGPELWLGIGAFLLVLALWSLVAELGFVHPQILPSPRAVVVAWARLFTEASYIGDIGISIGRVWAAFLASAVI